MLKAFHQLWDLVFYFRPGKVEMVCRLFCIRFPQPVNNSHKQRLSHSPTYLTCIQWSDSLHVMCYFSHQIGDMCSMISGNPWKMPNAISYILALTLMNKIFKVSYRTSDIKKSKNPSTPTKIFQLFVKNAQRCLWSGTFNVFTCHPFCCGYVTNASVSVWAAALELLKMCSTAQCEQHGCDVTRRQRQSGIRIDGVKRSRVLSCFWGDAHFWQVKLPSPLCSAPLHSAWDVAV